MLGIGLSVFHTVTHLLSCEKPGLHVPISEYLKAQFIINNSESDPTFQLCPWALQILLAGMMSILDTFG